MKVYVVTDGEYSDFHIEAIFTDEKKAKLYAATHYCNDIEEWETDEPQIEGDVDVFVVYKIGVYKIGVYQGNLFSVDEKQYSTKKRNEVKKESNSTKIYVSLTEQNEEKAKKIAQDMLAKYREENT